MTTRTPECPKCRRAMEGGFLMDQTRNDAQQTEWLEGAPEQNWLGFLREKGKTKIPVTTYRCPACGFLESYALNQ